MRGTIAAAISLQPTNFGRHNHSSRTDLSLMARRRTSSPVAPPPPSDRFTVPAGAPNWITPELIEHTLRVWQPYYATPLTTDDALAIIQSVGRLIEVVTAKGELSP